MCGLTRTAGMARNGGAGRGLTSVVRRRAVVDRGADRAMVDSEGLSRRRLLSAGGIGIAALGLGTGCGDDGAAGHGAAAGGTTAPGSPAEGTATATSSAGKVCVMTPEVTEGPYYLDEQDVRRDITEGKPGFPLRVTFTVVDVAKGCRPVADAPVEIWHCDAWGYYSGYQDKAPGGEVPDPDGVGDADTYLRGVQVTDAAGKVAFTSIVPGWYSPRVTHIHIKVHDGGEVGKTYEGGTTAQTTQALFPDDVCEEYSALEPYVQHGLALTKLENDQVYGEAERSGGDPDAMVPTLTRIKQGSVRDGYTMTMTLGIGGRPR
ncbi:MAG: protocatechuate dioxygenase [Streptosporangiales bacterium]|nr:protocatechuate dioxygenase [Streptosporangiales bacterium]